MQSECDCTLQTRKSEGLRTRSQQTRVVVHLQQPGGAGLLPPKRVVTVKCIDPQLRPSSKGVAPAPHQPASQRNRASSGRGKSTVKRGKRQRNTGTTHSPAHIQEQLVPQQTDPCFFEYQEDTWYPAVLLTDLGAALHRFGVLPVQPGVSERKFRLATAAQQLQHAMQLNDFLDLSYELQQRGHLLWVAEQQELQRGAQLAILSPADYQCDLECVAPVDPTPQHTPAKAHYRLPHTDRSPADVLLSPQTAAALLVGPCPHSCLSPALEEPTELLSPSVLGLLNDPSGHPGGLLNSPTGTSYVIQSAQHERVSLHQTDTRELDETAYVHAHTTWAGLGKGTMGPSLRPLSIAGSPTPPRGVLRSVGSHLSPLSPGGFLMAAADGCHPDACMDLLGSYGAHQGGAHMECDVHVDIRLEVGGPAKRVKR